MASHILDEVEKICSHVAIIRKGKLLAMGTVGAIINNDKTIEVGANDLRRLNEILANFPKIKAIKVNPDRLSLSVTED
jgi:ABC-2 type transport system ATP-binding protein